MIDNKELHKDRLKDDKYYAKKTNPYKLLKNSTANGTARGKVEKYDDTKTVQWNTCT